MSAVPAGYKQTEVGVIPDKWVTQTIAQASRKIQDYRGRTPKKLGMDWGGGDIPALSAGNVKMGFIDFDEECYLASETLYKRWMVNGDIEQGDIVFTMEAPLGNVALIPDNRKYILSQRTVLLQPNSNTTFSPFLYQVLMSRWFQQQLHENATGSTAQGIQRRKFETLAVVCPPLPEQRAIAAALSDVDALLVKLEQFIAKKRDIKQAAMQQLLTGQTRLPGFSEAWEVKRLGDVASFYKGKGLPKSALMQFGAEPCIHYGELFTQYKETIRDVISRTDDTLNAFRSIANDVLMPTSDVTPRGLAKASCITEDGVILGGDILIIRSDRKSICGTFLSYVIRSEEDQVLQLVTGSTVFHLYGTDMKKFSFSMPSLSEQTAIATVLSDMDTELATLEARRDKTRALKQGMMQELLTGRIRLV